MDIRLGSSGGLLDAIRRIEYLALLAISGLGVFYFQPYGYIVAGPLVVLALALVPRGRAQLTRERARLDALNELQTDGLSIRSRWLALSETPLTDESSVEHWRVQRDTLIWLSNCSVRLGRFPEVGGIFNAHLTRDSLVNELDSCLHILSRIRRLVGLSESLRLPI